MWPWKKGRRSPKVSPETLEERLDALEGSFRGLKNEWLDTYDKLYRLAGRLDASRRWSAEKPGVQTPTEPAIVPENGSEGQTEAPLPAPPAATLKMTRQELLRSLTR